MRENINSSIELLRTQRGALERGVRIRHVLQQVKPSNFHVADKWRRLGVRLRYLPSERGALERGVRIRPDGAGQFQRPQGYR